jgi:FtsP/CotA-like multicopper oxidase with cupredoxin domain
MSTEDQVSGGAVGMVIIEDKRADNSYSDIPSSATTNNPNLATFLSTEKLLFFSEIYTDIATTRTRYVNGIGPLSSSNIPQITLVANQWYRFRVASSKPSGTNSVYTFPGACTVRQLARDGIFLSTVPATQSSTYNIAGPSRIDLAVRCTVSSTPVYITWDNTYRVQVISNTGTPNGGSPFMPDGLSQWQPVRPSYLQDMRNVAVQSSFSMQASPSTMSFNGATGVQFSTTTPITTLTYNRVYEMRVITNNNHPLHLHVYPMQIIGVWSTNTNSVTPGDCVIINKVNSMIQLWLPKFVW